MGGTVRLTSVLGDPELAGGVPLLGQALLLHTEAFAGENRCLPAGRPGQESPQTAGPCPQPLLPGHTRVQEGAGQATCMTSTQARTAQAPTPPGAGHLAGAGPGAELEVTGHS